MTQINKLLDEEWVYGKYSLGSGAILSDPSTLFCAIDYPKVIEDYKRQIITDLEKSGVPIQHIRSYSIMNVGTGREAIAFNYLGAKTVRHYDLSLLNVQKMQHFIKENSLEKTLSTKYLDVVKGPLPKNHFDYIYLHGIVQHFSDVGAGLLNCIGALKPNGLIWLYFYRSGSFPQFLVYMIRDLIADSKNAKEYHSHAILSSSNRQDQRLYISDLMDDLFTPHHHLYSPTEYMSFISRCGLEVISSSKLDPFGKNVDHKFAHPSVVLVCKKTTSVDLTLINTELLSPSNSVNQLDEANYTTGNEDILKSISSYQNLKQMIMAKKIPSSIVMSIAFRLYDFNYTSLINYKKTGSFNGHGDLQKILTDTIHLLNEEFPRQNIKK